MSDLQANKPNRLPWLIVGGLGCVIVCLVVVIAAGGFFFLANRGAPNVATGLGEASPTVARALPPATDTAAPTGGRTPTLSAPLPTLQPAALASATATATTTPTPAAPTGKIAFSVGRGDRPEDKFVFVMNVDGTGVKQILDRASEPTFSPDGTKIAYYHWTDGIFVANADGANVKKIIGDTFVGFIEWSHDGKWIAFSSQPGGTGNIVIAIVAPDGTGQRTAVVGESPSWSPDDSELVFHTCRDTRCGIYKSKASGGDAMALSTDDGGLPSWSPDGKLILYQRDVDGVKQLFLMNADGSNRKQLTAGAALHVDAVWSPDGRFIYYRSTESGTWGIWRMNADGANPTKLLDNVPPVSWPYEKLAITK